MVLKRPVPPRASTEALVPLIPGFLSYAMSFVFIGIYWNNHHHMFHVVRHVNGAVLWANLHLLFWLSLTPYVMSWLGESGLAPWPVAMYGVVLLMSAIAYTILVRPLLAIHGPESRFAPA